MDRFFCNGKEDFCDDVTKCSKCKYKNGSGGFWERDVKNFMMRFSGYDYDLDHIRELVEIVKDVPHKCNYCIGCGIEPKDGHGCDVEHDGFVFSARRLRELVHADRDGRCVVLPCEAGERVWFKDIDGRIVDEVVLKIGCWGGNMEP